MRPAGDTYPLPEHPRLAEAAAAVRDAGHWAMVVDAEWRLVYVTDDLRRTFGAGIELAEFAIGHPIFGQETRTAMDSWRLGANTADLQGVLVRGLGPMMLADLDGDRDAFRAAVAPEWHDIVETIEVADAGTVAIASSGASVGEVVDIPMIAVKIRDADGSLAGVVLISKPAPGMAAIASLTSEADAGHVAQMQAVAVAGRRPAAILFADLEGSTPLSRRLSTAAYFTLGRRLVRAADRCVIDAGGLVGRHVGDGVVAFFLAESLGSESVAARACIEAARALQVAVRDVAARSNLTADDVVVRFGLHWGSTLYVGNILTAGRSEVTALGDEVNETARIEACASGGRTLASKELLERLDSDDAVALDLDPARLTYTVLADLPTATEKARRDAPAIAVHDVGDQPDVM